MHLVRSLIARCSCRSDQPFHRCKDVRVFHAEYFDCILKLVDGVLWFHAVVRLDSPNGVDEVARDVARDVAGDVAVSHFRSPDCRKLHLRFLFSRAVRRQRRTAIPTSSQQVGEEVAALGH